MHTALTIAGSDSGGGAGIQADLKTFAALGVHGMSAVTSVTVQNTMGVLEKYDIPPRVVSAQIDALAEDVRIDFAKTGMLSSESIVNSVADAVKKHNIPLVVDPVMAASAGGVLLSEDAVQAMIENLLPKARVVTPNIFEAERLSGIRIRNSDDAKEAALRISGLGVPSVIIKGGHLDASDLVYTAGEFTRIEGKFIEGGKHGSGCTHSAALTAELARGTSLIDAAFIAKKFVEEAIENSVKIGRGAGLVNQASALRKNAGCYLALKDLKVAVGILTEGRDFHRLIPEVGCNIGIAIPDASSVEDIAAVPGRIVNLNNRAHPVGCPSFGASSHVARIILTAMKFDNRFRSCINFKYSEEIIRICKGIGLKTSSFRREDEPEGVSSMEWGVSEAIRNFRMQKGVSEGMPDIIFDRGGIGKEPMTRLIGTGAAEIAKKAIVIAEKYYSETYYE